MRLACGFSGEAIRLRVKKTGRGRRVNGFLSGGRNSAGDDQ